MVDILKNMRRFKFNVVKFVVIMKFYSVYTQEKQIMYENRNITN